MTLRHLLVLWLALLCLPVAAGAQTFPPLTGRVVDNANLLDPAQEQALDAKLAAVEKDTGRQLVVATLPGLQGYDIADYGYRLGRAWGIGSKDKNDGALLIVAPNERRVRIEVGYGLEGVLTDALSALIINNVITPRFKDGDYPGGINGGIDQIIPLLKLTPEQAKARAAAWQAQARKQEETGRIAAAVIVVVFFVIIFAVSALGARGRGRRYGGGAGIPPVILWGPGIGSGSGSGWSGGGWGSGSGGGGGFSGGGGSFGGGGASGGW